MNIYASVNTPCEFARDELKKYSSLIFTDIEIANIDIFVGLSEQGETVIDKNVDEIYVDISKGKGKIVGSNKCAVLIAVYRFLRECGCRFLRPGKDGEFLPKTTILDKKVFLKERADSDIRSMIIEGSSSFENVYNMIDFCPKIGLNCYEFQFRNSFAFFSYWYNHKKNPYKKSEGLTQERVDEELPFLWHEVKRRGMRLQTLGHGFTAYPIGLDVSSWDKVDTDVSEENKKYLALVDGKRELINGSPFLTNLCYSNRELQEKMADFLVDYCKNNPDVDVVKFALADKINVLCECENCRDHRLSDLIVRMLNRIDERMTEQGLTQQIYVCAYLDALWAPIEEKINNPDRFYFGFFPICHVYHEPMPTDNIPEEEPFPYVLNRLTETDDCRKNLAFLKSWKKQMPESKWVIGEYHYMWDHYIDIGYQKIARILHDDIANQDKLGFCGMQSYQPQRCAVPTAMGLQTFGATLWNHKTDFDALSADYFYHAYGECWQDVYSYLDGLSSRYDFIIKPGGRNILALDCVPVMEDCLAAVRDFCAKYDNTTSDNSARTRSWKDLCLYNKYLRELLSAFILGLRGNEAEGKSKIDALVDWLWSIEDEVQERWDIYVLTVHLPVWYNRLMKVKRDEEQGIFTHSYSWFPSGDQ